MPKALLIVFAKAPVVGAVNTRLIPHIGAVKATALQQELIELRMLQFANNNSFDVQLCCAPDASHEVFQTCASQYRLSLNVQRGDDLGQCMAYAFNLALQQYDSVILIGTDAPEVDKAVVDQAFAVLLDNDVVLQPAEDGGYVLIGMRKYASAIFHAVRWGTQYVLQQTRANIVAAGYSCKELEMSWDIDRPEDLQRYRQLQTGKMQ